MQLNGSNASALDILIVDDSAAMRALIARCLRDAVKTRSIRYAVNGQDALDQLEERRPDLVLLDLSMPVMRGDEVLAHLRAHPRYAQLPIIVISSEQSSDRSSDIAAAGAAFVSKPFLAIELKYAIHGLLGAS